MHDQPSDILDPTGILQELMQSLRQPSSFEAAMDDVVQLAARHIPGADAVSITLLDERAGTIATSDDVATQLDERQYESDWGPCIHAARHGQVAEADDMTAETRWPDFAAAAVDLGVGSSLSTPMPVQQHVGGAINCYSRKIHGFNDQSRNLAAAFATHAALALAQSFDYTDAARRADSLQDAMRSRAVIEQAKGILMAARECTASEAFDLLVTMSQHSHVKLRDVAARLVSQASSNPVSFDEG